MSRQIGRECRSGDGIDGDTTPWMRVLAVCLTAALVALMTFAPRNVVTDGEAPHRDGGVADELPSP